MRNAKSGWALSALAGLVLASCASDERSARTSSPLATEQPRPSSSDTAPSNVVYVKNAASIDLFEIQSAELARSRLRSGPAREFASMMLIAHRGTSAQLSFAGRRLDLLPSARMNDRHRRMMDELTSSATFDASYRRQQAMIHQEALALHGTYASKGLSPTLRAVAKTMTPIVERHIRMLRTF